MTISDGSINCSISQCQSREMVIFDPKISEILQPIYTPTTTKMGTK